MSLLSAAEVASIREALEVVLTHRCTLTLKTADGVEGEDGHTPSVPTAAPTYGVHCLFETRNQVVRAETGTTIVAVPSLTVSATLAIGVGYTVETVADQLGGILATGPFRVERLLDPSADLGAALLPVWELRGSRTVS